MQAGKELTIYDIAQMADVSPATVSRVLNRHPGINAKTREKVNEVLARTGFKPRWKAGGSNIIGVILPPYHDVLLDPYDSRILSCCFNELMDMEYSMQIICPAQAKLDATGKNTLAALNMLSGIIAVAAPPNYELCKYLLSPQNKLPAVVIGHLDNEDARKNVAENHIIADDYAAGYQSAMLLLRHHHRRFHVVSASLDDAVHRRRYEGIVAALKHYHIAESDIATLEIRDNLRQSGEQLAAELACIKDRPEALIFTQSSICTGFVHGCRAMNLNIPDDFSVVSFEDNNELAGVMPPITAIQTPTQKIGQAAVRALTARINNTECTSPGIISHALVSRHSVRQTGNAR